MTIDRIAYIGNFRHPFCTEVHLASTLESLGYQVDRIQEDEIPMEQVAERARASDMLLYTRTWGCLPAADLLRLWEELRGAGIVTASYHLDLYFGISRQAGVLADPFWRTEFVFTPDGDPLAAAWFAKQGINHHWIRPGVYRPECVAGRPNPELYPEPIVFVGTWRNYHREWKHRRDLIRHMQRHWGDRFGIWGHEDKGTIRGLPLNDLYATATVVVGDSLCPGWKKPNYWSDRAYETVGRGGYLIHPYVSGMDSDFAAGAHLDFYEFGNFKMLDELITAALDDPDRARRTASFGQANVRARCTYHDRLTEAFTIIGAADR